MTYLIPTCPKCGGSEDAIFYYPDTREEPGYLKSDPPDECSSDECDWRQGDGVVSIYWTFVDGERVRRERILDDWEMERECV